MSIQASIAVLEGDGIGPEITQEAVKVIRGVGEKYGHSFALVYAPFGARAYFEYDHPFPEETRNMCEDCDTIIKGPIGLDVKEMEKIPDEYSPERKGLLALRQMFDTYANYRPVVLPKSYADCSPLRPGIIGEGIDILMLRELVGGIYFGKKLEGKETGMKFAVDECKYTREQVERFARVVFGEARQKGCKVTNIHKKNVLATSRFWNTVFQEVAKQYPDVKLENMLVDAAAFYLVRNPRRLNGIVALENFQGDVLTDQGGGILGSLGLMGSACLNPETGRGYYEPAHGSAPDIAGKGKANPYSMIASVAFMFEKSFRLEEESRDVLAALEKVLIGGYRTSDLVIGDVPKEKILSTREFGDRVVENLMSD